MKPFQDGTAATADLHLIEMPPDGAGMAPAGLIGKVAIEAVEID